VALLLYAIRPIDNHRSGHASLCCLFAADGVSVWLWFSLLLRAQKFHMQEHPWQLITSLETHAMCQLDDGRYGTKLSFS
jgi:hypothetical protein